MPKRWNIKGYSKKLQQSKSQLPRKVGVITRNHFVNSFRRQGWTDSNLDPWAERKRADKDKRRRAILVKSGALKRSIRVKSATFRRIAVGSYGIVYSTRHNRGLKGMPKRQFIGESKVMTKQIERLINKELRKIFV